MRARPVRIRSTRPRVGCMTGREDLNDDRKADADELPDGSSSDGSESTEGEDTASGGGADD